MKYFLHDTQSFSDEKITRLYMEYGYEGIGLFYTILERIAAQEKPIITPVLKKQLFVGKKLEKCWNFMESIGLISSNNGETFNEKLLNFSEKYQIKKEKNAERIAQWRKNQEDKKNVTRSESVRNTPKEKISKVKRSKENEYTSAKADGITAKFLEVYNFYLSKHTGSTEKFSVAGRKGLSEIIQHFQGIVLKKNPDITPGPEFDQSTLDCWKYLWSNFDRWDSFYKRNLNLNQINSNLINIISSIKNQKSNGHVAEQRNNKDSLTSLQNRAREIIRADGEATNSEQYSEHREGE